MKQSVVVQQGVDRLAIDCGDIRVKSEADGHTTLSAFGQDYRPAITYMCRGRRFTGGAGEQQVTICEPGPIRAAIQVAGRCVADRGDPGIAYRLRLDLFAGLPTVVARVWFVHDIPQVASLPIENLRFTWSLPSHQRHHLVQTSHGLVGKPRFVSTPDEIRAAVGHDGATVWRLVDAAPLRDDTDYPPHMMPPCDQVSHWFGATGKHGWMAVAMDDIREMLPKAMTLAPGRLDIELWPDFAGVMNLPQGRSRSVTVRFAFGPPSPTPTRQTFESSLATTSPEPVLADWPADVSHGYFDLAELLPHRAGDAQRFDDYLRKCACPPTVADFIDLGDTPDPGYQTTYLSTGRRLKPTVSDDELKAMQFHAGAHFAATPWSDFTQYEQVWANNEYDVIWCIACEALRSRRADMLRPLRWYARHAIEVDFVHYSDHRWKHRCTPAHSADHTFAGAYPSHFWTEGVLAWHLLSGDDDALEFARGIGDKIIEFGSMVGERKFSSSRKNWEHATLVEAVVNKAVSGSSSMVIDPNTGEVVDLANISKPLI
ncbi:MAG: hypothetical protein HQ481_22280, partial [Alphaproteobacteria bacterium]|nr:hypothetical protein [Alphaproteobacteria bacterium]